jgi:hypothetical protein
MRQEEVCPERAGSSAGSRHRLREHWRTTTGVRALRLLDIMLHACPLVVGLAGEWMSIGISLIVLLAAVLHASWNALLRAGADRLWSITVMCIAIALACAALAPFVPVPAQASWGYAILSALLHV